MSTPETYPELLAFLRALHWGYWTAHWLARGSNFYGDHQLFQRLYEALVPQIDTLAEKIVSPNLPASVDPVDSIHRTARYVETLAANEHGLVVGLYDAESSLNVFIDWIRRGDSHLPSGMDDYLSGLASEHDTNLYLLGQRLADIGDRSHHTSRDIHDLWGPTLKEGD